MRTVIGPLDAAAAVPPVPSDPFVPDATARPPVMDVCERLAPQELFIDCRPSAFLRPAVFTALSAQRQLPPARM